MSITGMIGSTLYIILAAISVKLLIWDYGRKFNVKAEDKR